MHIYKSTVLFLPILGYFCLFLPICKSVANLHESNLLFALNIMPIFAYFSSFDLCWKDINQEQSVALDKFSASYKYCEEAWNRREVSKLEEYLLNHCKGAPANVVRKYMTKVLERQDKSTKKESSRVVVNKIFTIIMTQQIFLTPE